MPLQMNYVKEPENKTQFTEEYNKFYTVFAQTYDVTVKILPFWKRWLKATIPHIQGHRVLEVSFGTGYLLLQYAAQFETYGIDYNEKFVTMLKKKLVQEGISADVRQGNVERLPYEAEFFDTIVNTMAFTGYPDGEKAMSEMYRVLKSGGKLIMVDIGYPFNRNRLGILITKAWIAGGDIVRDMAPLFRQFKFEYTAEEIGGFGSVHLYVAQKK